MQETKPDFTLFIVGIIFAVVGALSLYHGGDTKFICNRTKQLCNIETVNIFGLKTKAVTIPLVAIRKAEIYSHTRTGKNHRSTYGVMLNTSAGQIQITGGSNHKDAYDQAKKMNNYINSNQENIKIVTSGRLFSILGFVFLIVGLCIVNPFGKENAAYNRQMTDELLAKHGNDVGAALREAREITKKKD